MRYLMPIFLPSSIRSVTDVVCDVRSRQRATTWFTRVTSLKTSPSRTATTTSLVFHRRRAASPSSSHSTSWRTCYVKVSRRPGSPSVWRSLFAHVTTLRHDSSVTSPMSPLCTLLTQRLWNSRSVPPSDSDSVYWTCSQKAKNQKAKQTITHCTTKQNTRQEMQCNAMEKKWTKDSDIGLLVFYEGLLNERSVAVGTLRGLGYVVAFVVSRDVISVLFIYV